MHKASVRCFSISTASVGVCLVPTVGLPPPPLATPAPVPCDNHHSPDPLSKQGLLPTGNVIRLGIGFVPYQKRRKSVSRMTIASLVHDNPSTIIARCHTSESHLKSKSLFSLEIRFTCVSSLQVAHFHPFHPYTNTVIRLRDL
ncbi:hypothetical protein J6590_007023 [Homalodisca vitripennis]|nr:hypothetical protein J6590_007023 [Homalodisca vitripennis]